MIRINYKLIYFITITIFIISGILLGIFYSINGNIHALYRGIVTPLFVLVPFTLNKIKFHLPYRLYILYFLFLLMAYTIGLIMDGYLKYASFHYDKLIHFTSGFLFTTTGVCIFVYANKLQKNNNRLLGVLFALLFSMFIAVFFEFLEYFVYLTTNKDPQLNMSTGVVDTMNDLLVCFLSSMITCAIYYLYFYKGYKLFKYPIIEEFYDININGSSKK